MSTDKYSQDNADQKIFLTTKETQAVLRASRSSLHNYAMLGQLVPRKLGRKNLYAMADIQEFIAKFIGPSEPNGGAN